MATSSSELLLHPVRLRIVLAFGAERLTTAQLADRLPDIAHATLYRHVAMLADAGVLDVVAQRRVRGGIERTYVLAADAGKLGPEAVSTMSKDEVRHGFGVFVGALMESLGRYLDDPAADLARDPVSFRQAALWVDEHELDALLGRIADALAPILDNEPTEGRERLLLNTVLIPDRSARPASEH